MTAPAILSILLAATAMQRVSADSGPVLRLPERPADAIGGTAFARKIAPMADEAREKQIYEQVMAGNVPSFLRKLVAVSVRAAGSAAGPQGKIYVTPDYLAVGTDDDFLFVPMTPYTAQRIADRLHCLLPTPRMVDEIYAAAPVHLDPSPIPPSAAMTSVPVFLTHTQTVITQRRADPSPLNTLTAGDKKDIVVCRELADNPGHVAIYGWQKPDGKPIQPLYLGHNAAWADYSHGVRLVANTMTVDGASRPVADVLRDPALCSMLSDEGPITQPRYVFHHFPRGETWIKTPVGERVETFSPFPGVRALVDTPTRVQPRLDLVIYALPNGNTIEQTFGKKRDPDEDFRYDIQQIGAQTRFVRDKLADESLVVVYLEAEGHAWPAWIRAHDPGSARQIIDAVRARFRQRDVHVTLDSHSGGGALLFSYIQSVDQIPDTIDRIAFLDSEYNYDPALHAAKLTAWLRNPLHYLCAIAYDDASALYQGKPVVSAQGGTWGRTHAMEDDLSRTFPLTRVGHNDPERYVGAGGRLVFLLKENPRHQIFHTVQVERNGFIESLLSGTPLEEKDYQYYGPRAYVKWIEN